jgi:hypothetical protein
MRDGREITRPRKNERTTKFLRMVFSEDSLKKARSSRLSPDRETQPDSWTFDPRLGVINLENISDFSSIRIVTLDPALFDYMSRVFCDKLGRSRIGRSLSQSRTLAGSITANACDLSSRSWPLIMCFVRAESANSRNKYRTILCFPRSVRRLHI